MGWTNIKWDDAMLAASRKGLTQAALAIEGQAVRLCPVGQYPTGSGRVGGRLRGSITYAVRGGRSNPTGEAKQGDGVSEPNEDYVAHVGTNVEYAPYVEYGTRRMGAQPYLRPAMDITRSAASALYGQAISEELKRRAK